MSAEGFEIRDFCSGDEIAINLAYNEAHDCQRSLDEWSWRFPTSSEGRAIALGLRGGRVVAHCGGVPVSIQSGERVVPALMMKDVFSLPEAGEVESGAGALTDTVRTIIHDARARGLAVLAIAGGPSQLAAALSGGEWAPLQMRVATLLRSRRSRSPFRRWFYRAELARDWEPRLGDLWRRARTKYPRAVVRNATMALGRFAGHPRLRFHRFLVFPRLSRVPVAWVVFTSGDGVCRWQDLVWDQRYPGALEMVAHLSAMYCVQMGVEEERVVLGGDSHTEERLLAMGYEHDPEEQHSVSVFAAGPEDTPLEIKGSIYLTESDLDRV